MANYDEYKAKVNDTRAELTGRNLITAGEVHLNDLRDLQSTNSLTSSVAYSPMEGNEYLTSGGHSLDIRSLISPALLQGNDLFFNMMVEMRSASHAASSAGLRESILINILACGGNNLFHMNHTNLYNHNTIHLDSSPGSTVPALRSMFCG